jgi:hypothetical protein
MRVKRLNGKIPMTKIRRVRLNPAESKKLTSEKVHQGIERKIFYVMGIVSMRLKVSA